MRRYTIEIRGKTYVIDVEELTADRFQVQVGDDIFEVHLSGDEDLAEATITPEIISGKTSTRLPPSPRSSVTKPHLSITDGAAQSSTMARPTPSPQSQPAGGKAVLTSPMPGTIVSIAVVPGATVTRGQAVLVLEAMKMKNVLKAAQDGVVAEVLVQPGQTVAFGDVLLRLEEMGL